MYIDAKKDSMRRCICLAEPAVMYAGQTGTWKFVYIPAQGLPQNTLLRFHPYTTGEEGEWQLPEAKAKANTIVLHLPNGKAVSGKEAKEINGSKVYDFSLPAAVSAGERLTIQVGNAEGGNKVQSYIQRRRNFHLFVDPKGKGDFKEPEVFAVDVKGNALKNIRMIVPSIVFKNSRFDVFIRFEDSFGNLTGNAPEGTLIELSYDQLRENLKWKLFVPETGFLTLPNLYFNEAGVYRIRLCNLQTKQEYFSSPIKCLTEAGDQLFWGVLHGESKRLQKAETIETVLRHFRDDHAFQFYATSFPEDAEETSNDDWKLISNQVSEFNEEERFVTMLGFEWAGESSVEGVRHFIYAKDNKPILRKKDAKMNSLKKIYKSHTPKEILAIPCLTMAKGYSYDFENFHPEFERVVEIYSAFGSQETSAKKGNVRPLKSGLKKGVTEVEEGSIRKALISGCRFGFVAGGAVSNGAYKDFNTEEENLYPAGLTAIFAKEYSRDCVFQALYKRRCYATTGARIIVSFAIADTPMGSELSTKLKPGLLYNRHISCFIAGTDEIQEVVVIRNGEILKTYHPNSNVFQETLDDADPIEPLLLKGREENPPFLFYYVRVTQKDGHIAWASPIFIDFYPEEKKRSKKK